MTNESIEIEEFEYSDVEVKAMDKGWRPESEWSGANIDWRPAKEFLDRGELMDRISDQTKQLKTQNEDITTLKSAVKSMGDHNKKIAVKEYEKALKELKSQKAAALESYDHATVVELDDKIDDLKAAKVEPKQEVTEPANQMHPEISTWIDKNTWYRDDIVLRGAVDSLSMDYIEKHPSAKDNVREVLDYVDKTIRDEFPHKFDKQQRRPAATSEPGEPVARTREKGKNSKNTKQDLNEMQRTFCKTLVAEGALTEQEYIDQIADLGELDKQKGIL